jgi:PPOX class probable F420-dependent enzyme
MGISLSDEEIWAFLGAEEVGVLTTLRADGQPVSVPVWFASDVGAGVVWVAGPAATAKFRRVRRDPRVAFLVESGRRWVELKAVHLEGTAAVVEDPDWEHVDALLGAKYAAMRGTAAEQPESAKRRYATRALMAITPHRIVSWDNAKLRPPR